ncbi:MAG TPA: hypothetical protein VM077_03205 [Candidatus Limnocylindrales bacterium]|nr:hypothetical protein [Candidatus Limnocylindrales bacterium]
MRAETMTHHRSYTEYDQRRVRDVLGPLGFDFQYCKVTGTTMDDALASDRPTIWVADSQTEGRGRSGNRWYDTPKANVLATFAVDRINLSNPLLLPQFVALAACRATRTVTKSDGPEIRWPYDLEIDGKKFGGILVEQKISTTGKPLTLIGVGMNIHDQAFPQFPWEAVALEQVPGIEPIDRNTLLTEFTKELATLLSIINLVDSDSDAYATWNSKWKELQSLGGQNVLAENIGPDKFGDAEGIAKTPMLGRGLDLVSTDSDGRERIQTVFEWHPLSLIKVES